MAYHNICMPLEGAITEFYYQHIPNIFSTFSSNNNSPSFLTLMPSSTHHLCILFKISQRSIISMLMYFKCCRKICTTKLYNLKTHGVLIGTGRTECVVVGSRMQSVFHIERFLLEAMSLISPTDVIQYCCVIMA